MFRAATGKYLGNKKFFEHRKLTTFAGKSLQIQKTDYGLR